MNYLNRESRIHLLKVRPEYFRELISGKKTAEIRFDDRDYRIGDFLDLREWKPGKKEFTGRGWITQISSITRLYRLIPDVDYRWCILSLRRPE